MVCNEQCLKLFGLDQQKKQAKTQEFNIVGETIRRGEIQIEHAHLTKLNKDFCPSTSDLGSESDSGLGSVRTSKKESDSQKTVSEPEEHLNPIEPESTICTVTRADSMGTLAQDCYSLDQFDDEFISIFDGHASETLTDLVMQEFSKMKTIDVFQLKSDFEKFERVGLRPTHKPRATRSSALPQLIIAQTKIEQKDNQPVKAVTEQPQVQKREKKMRKKRKMIRQKIEGANESSTSSSESDIVQQKPKRKTQSTEQQAVQAANGDKQ